MAPTPWPSTATPHPIRRVWKREIELTGANDWDGNVLLKLWDDEREHLFEPARAGTPALFKFHDTCLFFSAITLRKYFEEVSPSDTLETESGGDDVESSEPERDPDIPIGATGMRQLRRIARFCLRDGTYHCFLCPETLGEQYRFTEHLSGPTHVVHEGALCPKAYNGHCMSGRGRGFDTLWDLFIHMEFICLARELSLDSGPETPEPRELHSPFEDSTGALNTRREYRSRFSSLHMQQIDPSLDRLLGEQYNGRVYKCCICPAFSVSKSHLHDHLRTHRSRTDSGDFLCPGRTCFFAADNIEEFIEHMQSGDCDFLRIADHQAGDRTRDTQEVSIGFIYMVSSVPGEVNIGLAIDSNYRGEGHAGRAIDHALAWAFETMKFHRVQACVINGAHKHRALSLFARSGFREEGTSRRSHCTQTGEWVDTTYCAILSMDWMMRAFREGPPSSRWDQMLARHECEREEALRWDARMYCPIKRPRSTEIVREGKRTLFLVDPMFTDGDVPSSGTDTDASMDPREAKEKGLWRVASLKGSDWESDSDSGSSHSLNSVGVSSEFERVVISDTESHWDDLG